MYQGYSFVSLNLESLISFVLQPQISITRPGKWKEEEEKSDRSISKKSELHFFLLYFGRMRSEQNTYRN